nr:MAG TPA: hypothetical protein [Caudoviricetes sp.]
MDTLLAFLLSILVAAFLLATAGDDSLARITGMVFIFPGSMRPGTTLHY